MAYCIRNGENNFVNENCVFKEGKHSKYISYKSFNSNVLFYGNKERCDNAVKSLKKIEALKGESFSRRDLDLQKEIQEYIKDSNKKSIIVKTLEN